MYLHAEHNSNVAAVGLARGGLDVVDLVSGEGDPQAEPGGVSVPTRGCATREQFCGLDAGVVRFTVRALPLSAVA